jgi:hypothetical protein
MVGGAHQRTTALTAYLFDLRALGSLPSRGNEARSRVVVPPTTGLAAGVWRCPSGN